MAHNSETLILLYMINLTESPTVCCPEYKHPLFQRPIASEMQTLPLVVSLVTICPVHDAESAGSLGLALHQTTYPNPNLMPSY